MREFIYLLETGQPVKILSKKRITEKTDVTKIRTGELQIRLWERHIAENKMAWCMPCFPEISPKRVLELKFVGEITND